MQKWLINTADANSIDANDRGLAYGDGLFETIAVRNSACRFLDAHLQRLQQSCKKLAIPAPDETRLIDNIRTLIADQDCEHGVIKIIVTRGTGPRGYGFKSESLAPTIMTGISATEPAKTNADGIRAQYCLTPASRNSSLAGMKTLNRLAQVMARSEWTDPQIAEGLMTDDRGNLVGGTMTNLFVVAAGELWTPPVTEFGVAGVMRSKILQIARDLKLKIKEDDFSLTFVNDADELFVSNSLIGIWPINSLNERSYPVGPVTHQLMEGLASQGVTECQL